jgi:hypothetical protein
MRLSRRTSASPLRRPTSPAVAESPPNRLDDTGENALTKEKNRDERTADEVSEPSSEELAERLAMSLIGANLAAPVNAAAALNVLSTDSTAGADGKHSAEIVHDQ